MDMNAFFNLENKAKNEKEEKGAVDYDGKCPLCGSSDGTIIRGADGKYRNMCRVMGCPAFYLPAPAVGFDSPDDCRNPFETEYVKKGVLVSEYLGKEAQPNG